MDDPTGGVSGWQVAGWIWGILMSAFAGIFATKAREIDRLKETSVTQPVCDRTTDRLRSDFGESTKRLEDSLREHRQETMQGFQRVFDRLDKLAEK